MNLLKMMVVLLLVTACNGLDGHKQVENGRKRVLCTTAMIGNMVAAIGGPHVSVQTLITGEHDPHSYKLVKGDDEKFERADLIFYNGLGLEHGPSLKAALERSNKAYSLGTFLEEAHPSNLILLGRVYDPHIWMDIALWAKCVPFITECLIKEMPALQEEIEKNSQELLQTMLSVHQKIREEFQAIPEEKRYLVTTHDAFQYFARAYLASASEIENGTWTTRVAAPEGLAPESQLSTVDIVNVVNYMRQHKVHVIFAESNVSRDSIKKIVDAASKDGFTIFIVEKPLYADAMGPKGSSAENYLGMMQYDANAIQKALLRE